MNILEAAKTVYPHARDNPPWSGPRCVKEGKLYIKHSVCPYRGDAWTFFFDKDCRVFCLRTETKPSTDLWLWQGRLFDLVWL